jgi:hypothetical protein
VSKGKTYWFPRRVEPVRKGEYECAVQISRSVRPLLWRLEWDGFGFKVPFPMVVLWWRGMTKGAHIDATKGTP